VTVIELQRRYRTLGRVRLGDKRTTEEGKVVPVKLATWRLTSPSSELLERAAAIWGGKVAVWKDAPSEGEQFELLTKTAELEAYVPPQDLDRSQYLELWSAGGVQRRCDGVTELISGRECMCSPDERKCQITTHLLVILPQIPDLGVWRLTTHGWNAAGELPATVELLRQVHAEGAIPAAVLGIEQRTKKTEGKTHHFAVPVLRLPYTLAEAEKAGHHVLTQGRGKPALPGERPALPGDPSFKGEREAEWGSPPPLPDETANGAATREQVVKLHALAGSLGWTDSEKHELAGVASFNDLSKERASSLIEDWQAQVDARTSSAEATPAYGEGVSGSGVEGTSEEPGSEDSGGLGASPAPPGDGLASAQEWAVAKEAGLTTAKAKAMAKGLWPEVKIGSAADLTSSQLAAVLEKVKGSR